MMVIIAPSQAQGLQSSWSVLVLLPRMGKIKIQSHDRRETGLAPSSAEMPFLCQELGYH